MVIGLVMIRVIFFVFFCRICVINLIVGRFWGKKFGFGRLVLFRLVLL